MLYLIAGMPALAQLRIDRLDVLDVAVALGALAQHDGRPLRAIDVAGREEPQRDHVQADPVLLAPVLQPRQIFDREVALLVGILGVPADIVHAVALEELQALLRWSGRSDIPASSAHVSESPPRAGGDQRRGNSAGARHEDLSTIHGYFVWMLGNVSHSS